MTQLAAPMTLAAALAMVLAALRLWTEYDAQRGRHHVVLTIPLIIHIFLSSLVHGAAALLPFLPYGFWPDSLRTWVRIDPWAVSVLAPLIVNRLLSLEGFDLLKALGSLGKFARDVQQTLRQSMVEEEYIVLREVIDPIAEKTDLRVAKREMRRSIPPMLAADKQEAFEMALKDAATVEDGMELYIRHIGKRTFLKVLAPRLDEAMRAVQLALFEVERVK
jgi:hypothetical protein